MGNKGRERNGEALPSLNEEQAHRDSPPDEGRRRFAKAGAAGLPVMLTLASRPVWAHRCTISGMISGNDSSPGELPCEGCTPGYWGQHPEKWPGPYTAGGCKQGWNGNHCASNDYDDTGTKFKQVFTGDTRFGEDLTMMQVIHLGGNEDPYQLGAHAVAALLNAAKAMGGDMNFGYTPGDIIDLYNAHHATSPEELKNSFQMLNERSCPL